MGRSTTLLTGLACVVLLVAGCGSSDAGETSAAEGRTDGAAIEAPPTTSSSGDDPDAGSTAGGETTGSGATCEAVSERQLGDAFPDVAFGAPERVRGMRQTNDLTWMTEACRWESDTVTLRAAVAGADGFPDGFVCAEPTGGVSTDGPVPVEGLGEQAWWTWDDFNGANATLAICDRERRIEVDVDAPKGADVDADTARQGATVIAEALLGS